MSVAFAGGAFAGQSMAELPDFAPVPHVSPRHGHGMASSREQTDRWPGGNRERSADTPPPLIPSSGKAVRVVGPKFLPDWADDVELLGEEVGN